MKDEHYEKRLFYLMTLQQWDAGEWFQLPRFFIRSMKEREAVLLSILISMARVKIPKEFGTKMWDGFPCSTRELMNETGWSKDKVERSLKILEKGDWIVTEIVGRNRTRRITIDAWELLNAQVKLFASDHDMDYEKAWKIVEAKVGKLQLSKAAKTQSPRRQNSGHGTTTNKSKRVPKEFLLLAKELAQGIGEVREINPQVNQWARSFRLLHTKDKAPVKKIQSVVKWYCRYLKKNGDLITSGNPDFVPIAYAGHTFRAKFLNIEAAMTRLAPQKRKKKKVKIHVNDEPFTREDILERYPDALDWMTEKAIERHVLKQDWPLPP